MADKYTPSLNLPDLQSFNQPTQQNTPSTGDYVTDINVVSQLKDPRFLEDLRKYYQDKGERVRYLNNDEMIDKFFSDQTWELLNTGSAVMGAVEAQQADTDQKARMNRIQQVYNRLPNFYQEGGRSTWDMLKDAVPAVILDPLNAIPVAKGFATAGTAARLATTQGKNATLAGIKQGAKTGAITEGFISGAQEGVINTANQLRDVELGLRDEVSQTEILGSTAFGAAAGLGVGGLLGAGAGAFGARGADDAVSQLRALGVDDVSIGNMTNEQVKAALADPDATRAMYAPEPETATEAEAEEVALDPAEEAFNADFGGDASEKILAVKREAEDAVVRAIKDQLPIEEIRERQKFNDAVAVLEGIKSRIIKEGEEITALAQSADQAQLRENAARIKQFNRAKEQFKVLIDQIDLDDDATALTAKVDELRELLGFRVAPEEEAAEAIEGAVSDGAEAAVDETVETATGGGDEVAVAGGGEEVSASASPETTVSEPPSESVAPAPFKYTTAKVKSEIEGLMATHSIDGDQLDEWITEGVITAPDGKMNAASRNQLRAAIRKQIVDDKKPIEPSPDTDEYLQTYDTANPQMRGWALSEGIDYRNLQSSSQAKQTETGARVLTRGVVRKAINARKDGDAFDPYAKQVRDDLDDILTLASAGNASDVEARNLIEALAIEGGDYKSSREDLLALFDYTNKKTDVSESKMSGREMTQTEKKFLTKRKRELKKSYPDASPETLDLMAQNELINRRAIQAGDETPVRGTGGAIEDAKKFTTAGRNTAGQIQGQLRRGTRISKGSPYTVTGGHRVNPATFGFEAALARAMAPPPSPLTGKALRDAERRAKKMIADGIDPDKARRMNGLDRTEGSAPGIVEYTTSRGEVVRTPNGQTVMKGGETAYADAVTKRAYSSVEFLLQNRDGIPAKSVVRDTPDNPTPQEKIAKPEVIPEADKTFEENMGDLLKEFAGDPKGLRAALVARAEQLADSVGASKKSTASALPGKSGDMVIIVREKSDPTNIRMMSRKQADAGATAADIIGQRKPNPEDWDIRYAPADTARKKSNLAAIFDTLPANPDLDGNSGAIISDTKAAEHLSMSPEDAAKTHFEASPQIRKLMVFFRQGDKAKYPVSDLWMALKIAHSAPWRATSKGHEDLGEAIALLEAKYAEVAPNGIRLGEEKRAAAVRNIRELFEKYSPDEVDLAVKFLRGMGGDTSIGPAIKAREDGGIPMLTSSTEGASPEQSVVMSFGKYDEIPNISQLYHETAHWAYEHILTPADRAEFWRIAKTAYAPGVKGEWQKKRLSKYAQVNETERPGETIFNFYDSPQEFFAWQFDLWASRKKSGDLVQNETFWRKIARYVESIFNRYANDAEIHPDLEPLFSKILPDSERAGIMMGKDATPKGDNAKQINNRYMQLQNLEKELEDAIERDSAEGIIDAHRMLVNDILLSVAPRRGTEERPNTGAYGPFAAGGQGYKPGNMNLIKQRIKNIDEIVTGKAFDWSGIGEREYNEKPRWLIDEGLEVIKDPQETADALRDFYLNGFGAEHPAIENLTRPAAMRNLNASSVKYMIDRMKVSLETAYRLDPEMKGSPPAGHKVKPDGEKPLRSKPSKKVRDAKKRNVRAKNAVTKEAESVSKTKQSKRSRKEQKGNYDPSTAAEVKTLGIDDLRRAYLDHRGSERGDQIAIEIVNKTKSEPLPADKVGVSREVLSAREPEIKQMLMEALYEGNSDKIGELTYELQRRATNKGLKKQGLPTISATVVNKPIQREISDNMGVPSSDGIPASSRAAVREMLSFITHRDPEAQYAARTMTYRMINLMGKTVQGDLNDVNILSSKDLARLAGADPDQAASASFADLRSPEFKKLRSDMRRLSIGLNKGTASPFDVVHEIGHMLTRADLLDETEMNALREAYTASSDTVKNRIIATYGNKYNDFANKEDALVKEWFSESLAKYMSERVARGDILEAMATGDIAKLKLRNSFDRAIDKMVEYVAYVLNGLVGRNDIKQQFRRLFLYGDMFEQPAKSPLADVTKQRAALHPSLAAAATFDNFNSSPRPRMNKIKEFVSNGVSNGGHDRIIPFYHGTPNGYAFNKADNPDVIMRPSVTGFYGPGIYLANSPSVASQIFAKKPTPESMRTQIMELDATDELKEELLFDAMDIHEVRKKISAKRRSYYMAQAEDVDSENLNIFRQELDELVEIEEELLNNLTSAGVKTDPLVLPTYVRVLNPVDFQRGTLYHGGADPLIQSIIRHVEMTETTNQKAINNLLATFNEGSLDGPDTYKALISFYRESGRSKLKAQAELNETLEDLGHDGILTTHSNTIDVEGTDRMVNNETYEGAGITYQGLVVFDPANVKHVDADEFDATDAAIYHRDVQPVPRGDVGDMVTEIAYNENIDNVSELDVGLYGEMLESVGVDSGSSSAVMSMMRGRTLTAKEEIALQRRSPRGFLRSQSENMQRLGMNWLAGWYKDFWPKSSQAFAEKYMPIERMISSLPDADGTIMKWFKESNPMSGKYSSTRFQPKSLSRIVKALRYGESSRYHTTLAPAEKKVATAIRAAFRKELLELRKQGVMIGDRGPNYIPHVWSKDKITADPEKFKEAMAYYFKLEKTANGEIPTRAEVTEFAEDMYLRLGTEEAEGLYKPAMGGSKNPTSDHIDYSRMIELEKYPAAMKALEPYLEDDLRFLLIKYFEGSTRRLTYMEKLGQNSHAYSDYMTVLENGQAGIAKLLSTNREFVVNRTAIAPSGPQEYQLSTTAVMPFEGDGQAATEFSEELVRIYQQKGIAAAKEMLTRIAPSDPDGKINIAYTRRADAILGALQDFGGVRARLTNDDVAYMNDAMSLVMKKPTSNSGGTVSRKWSKRFRSFNNVSLLAFTTLSSLGDTVLPLIRSGDFKSFAQGWYSLLTDPDYRKAVYDVGVAMENIIHERMIYMYGAPDNKLSQAFFNATMLTGWTNTNRMISGSVGFHSFAAMQSKARKNFDPSRPVNEQNTQYRTAHRYLSKYGMQDFLPNGSRGKEAIDNDLLSDPIVRTGIIKFADDTIFQPNPNDMPMFTNNPWGALAFQLKSFPLMMTRLSGYVIDEMKQGNFKPAMYFVTAGPGMGAIALGAKDVVQARGGEDEESPALRTRNMGKFAEYLGYDEKTYGDADDFLGWYFEGLIQMGGLGLFADLLHSTVAQVDNGAYGQTRIASAVLGPTVGLGFDSINVLAGAQDALLADNDSNAKERTGTRSVASRIPVVGGIRSAREGIVNAIAGEAKDKKRKGLGDSGLGSSGNGKGLGNSGL